MKKPTTLALTAAAAVLALGLTACGGNGAGGSGSGDGASKAGFDAGTTQVVNKSDKKGGTIKMAASNEWDSFDPGNTYYAYSWNFLRLYGRSLVMYKPAPGDAGHELVPDLAEDLGKTDDGGKTWTYKIRKGIKFEDGSPVTAKDVKYAVIRTADRDTFKSGPSYFADLLDFPAGYKGPYTDPNVNTDQAVSTPDDNTIVFHLKQPFGGFDYLAALPGTVPVPQGKDTGAKYQEAVQSTGPYKFEKIQPGVSVSLVRNDKWDASTDKNRTALPDRFEVALKANADDIDNRVLSGDLHIAVEGSGVQPASNSKVLQDPAAKERADNPTSSRLWFVAVIGTVAPFDNKDCRLAIQYAVDRVTYQGAMGGPVGGGEIATHLLPPVIKGSQKTDLYPAGADNKGDLAKAKEHLQKCGKPDGFTTNMAFRADRPREKAAAEAWQTSLQRVGIKLELKGLTSGDYFKSTVGSPDYLVQNGIGLATHGWAADWNDGYGFLAQLVDSRLINPKGGNTNLSVRLPEVDALLDEATKMTNAAEREKKWAEIDKKVMESGYIFPGQFGKSLMLRGKGLTNVFINSEYGMYDYVSLGLE